MNLVSSNSLHPWVRFNPADHLQQLSKSSNRWQQIAKISFIATGALSLIILTASLYLSSTSVASTLYLFSAIFIAPCVGWSACFAQKKQTLLQKKIENHRPIAQMFQEIKNWDDPNFKDFFELHKITPPPISLHSLLPLIARILAREKQLKELEKKSIEHQQTSIQNQAVRLHSQKLHWSIIEREIIPLKKEIQAALEIIRNPTLALKVVEVV
jgi:hypothetical protein